MLPVADYNFATFCRREPFKPEKLALIRGFYRYLVATLSYLHTSKLQHRDIKPKNILVRGKTIYLADFGISFNWKNLSRSTTVADSAKSWIYCAPEVANYKAQDKSANIWSLGCVFLEMATLLHNSTIDSLRQYFKKSSDSYRF